MEEEWPNINPVIILERMELPASAVLTPESKKSRSEDDKTPESGGEGSAKRKTLSKSDKKAREEERRKRLEAKEEEKRKKEEERKKREEEKRKKDEEKEEEKRKREEERKKREEEKRKKEEEKEEEKRKREEERKKREEEKEEEKRKKEEERKKKEEERKKKEEEKEEERKKKEEERKKKEEERLKALEEKRKLTEKEEKKKARESQSFLNFFKRTSLGSEETPKKATEQESVASCSLFKPFQLQANQSMTELVPSISKSRFDPELFERRISSQDSQPNELYLDLLKSGQAKPFTSSKSKKEENPQPSELIIVESTPTNIYKAKYIDVSEIRPAWRGTWRKKSTVITGRKPWARDSQLLDYEVESDEEWSEDEEGEDIVSSGSDTSRNGNDDFEMDDFLVPHGHLSEEEEALEEEEGDGPKKHTTLIKEEDLLKARSRKVVKLNPFVIGPYWMNKDNTHGDAFKLLEPYKCVFNF